MKKLSVLILLITSVCFGAEQTFNGVMFIPSFPWGQQSSVNDTIDADGEKVAAIFQIPPAADTKNISKIGWKTGTVTVGDTLKIGIYTVDPANGDPTTTPYRGMISTTIVVGNGDDNTWFTSELASDATGVSAGDFVSVVIEYDSYSSGNLQISNSSRGEPAASSGFGYIDHFTTLWSKDDEFGRIAFEFDDGSYVVFPGLVPWFGSTQSNNFSNSSDPDHRGLIFKLPFPFRLVGVSFIGDMDGDTDIILYDSDGTSVLETLSVDKDIRHTLQRLPYVYMFASAHSLNKDVSYRVVLAPSTGTGIDLDLTTFNSAAVMDSLSGGQNFHYTTKKDAGWTETTTTRPQMSILIDGFSDGVGVGGGGGGGSNFTFSQ